MKYLIIIVVLLAMLFVFLFIKKSNELPTIRKIVSDFFTAVSSDNKTAYESLLHPQFQDLFIGLEKQFPENFKNISSVAEGDGFLKVSSETGTTFEYKTIITYTYNNGQQLGVVVKLVKEEGKWLIYGIQFSAVK